MNRIQYGYREAFVTSMVLCLILPVVVSCASAPRSTPDPILEKAILDWSRDNDVEIAPRAVAILIEDAIRSERELRGLTMEEISRGPRRSFTVFLGATESSGIPNSRGSAALEPRPKSPVKLEDAVVLFLYEQKNRMALKGKRLAIGTMNVFARQFKVFLVEMYRAFEQPGVNVRVTSLPPAALVFVNGVKKAVTATEFYASPSTYEIEVRGESFSCLKKVLIDQHPIQLNCMNGTWIAD